MASSKMIGRGTPNIQRRIPRPMTLSPCELLCRVAIDAVPLCAAVPEKSVIARSYVV